MTILLRCNGFSRVQKAVVSRPATDHQTVIMILFLEQVLFWEVPWSFSVQSLRADCPWLSYTIRFSSHVTIQSRNGYLWRIKKKTHPNSNFFFFWIGSWGTYLLSIFFFPICFKCQMTVERLTLNSLATSQVVVRGSALMTALGCHCQLLMASYCTPHFQSSCLLFKTSWTTTALLSSLVVPGSNALLILQIFSAWKTKFWTWKRKLFEVAFSLMSFP